MNLNQKTVLPALQQKQQQEQIWQISHTIQKINQQNKASSLPSNLSQKDQSLNFQEVNASMELQHSQTIQPKRDNPVQIQPIFKKKRKTDQEVEQYKPESVLHEQSGNRKITQFFGNKSEPSIREVSVKHQSQSEIEKNPILKNLKEKILRKQKNIQQVSAALQRIRDRNKKYKEQCLKQKQEEKRHVVETITQAYKVKIYLSGIKELNLAQQKIKQQQKLKQLEYTLKLLRNQKDKKKKNRKDLLSDEQSNIFLELYDRDRQNYIKGWIVRYQKEKEKISMENKTTTGDQILYEIPSFIVNQYCNKNNSQKLCLCALSVEEQRNQILALNLDQLKFQVISFIKLPSLMSQKSIKQLMESIQNFQKKINQVGPLCNIYQSLQAAKLNTNWILFNREHEQQSISLYQFLRNNETIAEPLTKYIAKICIKLLYQFKCRTGVQIILTPKSIFFNKKFQIRVSSSCEWLCLLSDQYRQMKGKCNDLQYYPPESFENSSNQIKNSSIWSLGIVLYEAVYGIKPFAPYKKYPQASQQFYLLKELTFPAKPAMNQNFKQFIQLCLANPNERTKVANSLLTHPYFSHK